jgi:hypothetical protein
MNDREEKLVGKKIIKLQMTSQTKKKTHQNQSPESAYVR